MIFMNFGGSYWPEREKHMCPELKRFKSTDFGNRELYAYGSRITDGQDLNVNINTDDMNDIFIERWYRMKNGGITCDRKSIPIRYCPFCGAKLGKLVNGRADGIDEEQCRISITNLLAKTDEDDYIIIEIPLEEEADYE